MAGALRDYFDGADEISMGGPRWRGGLTTDTTADYPDLIRVPRGALYMSVVPATNDLKVVQDGITVDTDLSAALSAQDNNAGVLLADKGDVFEVNGSQYVAVYGPASTSYRVGFFTRAEVSPSGDIAKATATAGVVSTGNSTTTLLTAGSVFTGDWEDCGAYSSIVVAVKTDQDGTYTVQFSPDGVNQDSTLTRYYRTDQIEAPHRFTVTRRYFRVVFTNTSASDQTFLRLQTICGPREPLNAPVDSTLAQDFDSVSVRPTDYKHEVALGRRQGHTIWNKFGFNTAVGTSAEVVASWGGTFTPMTTARTLSIVSTDANDTNGGTGANNVVVYGIGPGRRAQTEVVVMNGNTPVITTNTWLGVNRIAIGLSGSGQVNAGTITATATTDLTIQGQIPAGVGTTQQCIFHIQEGHQALFDWLTLNVIRFGAGTEPVVTIKAWAYSAVSNSKYEVFRDVLDAEIEGHVAVNPPLPFPVGESSVFWLEAVSTQAATSINGRISLIEVRDADA